RALGGRGGERVTAGAALPEQLGAAVDRGGVLGVVLDLRLTTGGEGPGNGQDPGEGGDLSVLESHAGADHTQAGRSAALGGEDHPRPRRRPTPEGRLQHPDPRPERNGGNRGRRRDRYSESGRGGGGADEQER